MNKVWAILPTVISLILVVPNSKPALAEPITSPVPASLNLAQATTSLSRLTGQYLVQGQDENGAFAGVAWIQANSAGDKIEVHWSVDSPSIPGIEDYLGIGGLNSAGKLEVTYVGTTDYTKGIETFAIAPDGTLKATFNYTTPGGKPATGSETFIPMRKVRMPRTP
jgi:hypothetical protein